MAVDEVLYAYVERCDIVAMRLIDEFIDNQDGEQRWTVVPAAKMLKIWADSIKHGTTSAPIVRDERGLSDIIDIMVDNVIRLKTNTELCGHTQRDPADVVNDLFDELEWTEALDEKFGDYCQDKYGMWRISDYGLDKLEKQAIALLGATTDKEKLQALDLMFQVTHQRGDLSESFIEGGSKTLAMR